MSVLVTGGLGYIGAHVVRELRLRSTEVVVLDDLSSGLPSRIDSGDFVKLDLTSSGAIDELATVMIDYGVTSVVHLAGQKRVDESVSKPLFYYEQNVQSVLNVLQAMVASEVREIVFSSSAAVYGAVEGLSVSEGAVTIPLSPYGSSKLVGEWILRDSAAAHGLRAISLRYFNVAGSAEPRLKDVGAFNLIPIVLAQLRAGNQPQIFGNDYPTPDGTCERDYVHVLDLAEAHIAALLSLSTRVVGHQIYNVGTGKGTSVAEVVDLAREFLSSQVASKITHRRVGDAARVVADVERIKADLNWTARRSVEDMISSA